MTIEELAELTAEKLEALSDKELTAILSPYFIVTRPELAPRPEKKKESPTQGLMGLSPQKREALALLAQEGVDLSFLQHRRKKT